MSERTKAIISIGALIVVQIAALAGVQMDAGNLTEVMGSLVVVCATIFAAWKNHNFTDAAAVAQGVLDSIKGGTLPEDEAEVAEVAKAHSDSLKGEGD